MKSIPPLVFAFSLHCATRSIDVEPSLFVRWAIFFVPSCSRVVREKDKLVGWAVVGGEMDGVMVHERKTCYGMWSVALVILAVAVT